MAEDKFLPEYTVTDNPYGRMTFGPLGPEDKADGAALTVALKGGHYRHYNENGSQLERVPGSSHEVCGIVDPVSEKSDDEKEVLSKSITAENGDIVLNAESGNIKLIARNIYIESAGDKSDGSFMVKANDHITMVANEQLTLAASKVCLSASADIAFNTKGCLYIMSADIVQGSPLKAISKLLNLGPSSSILKALVDGVTQTCK